MRLRQKDIRTGLGALLLFTTITLSVSSCKDDPIVSPGVGTSGGGGSYGRMMPVQDTASTATDISDINYTIENPEVF